MKKFTLQNTVVSHQGDYANFCTTNFIDSAGDSQRWEFISKRDAVVILPITPQGNTVCVKSFRVPINTYVLEAPAGLLEDNINPLTQAKAELLEETGYASSHITKLAKYPMLGGLSNNFVTAFVAKDVSKISDPKLELLEDLTIEVLTPSQIRKQAREANQTVDSGLLALMWLAGIS